MIPLVLDIETLPLTSSLEAPYPRNDFAPPANYKNPDAIAGWHVQNETKWRMNRERECSLNPRLGRVLCAGCTDGLWYAEHEPQEADILRSLWDAIRDHEGRVVTWNGSFDLRFLVIRSALLGVVPSVDAATIRSWFKKYDIFAHFDVKAVITNYNLTSPEGLDEWGKSFGLPGKPDGVDGSSVAWLYAERQHEVIKDYCAGDVANTYALYLKLLPFFGGDR